MRMSLVSEAERADEDRELVDAVTGGDREAFGRLVRKYQHRIVGAGRALVSSQQDAEDLAQETFLRAYKGLRQFRGASTFRTWLFQILLNTARTFRTRRQARPEIAVDAGALESAIGPERLETSVVVRDQVTRALATLPPELREAVVLRDVEGLDYREIAGALGIPMGTVESRIFRGRERLRAALVPRTESQS